MHHGVCELGQLRPGVTYMHHWFIISWTLTLKDDFFVKMAFSEL